MANGGRIGRRNVPGVDGSSGVWTMQEIADATRARVWPNTDSFADPLAAYTKYTDSAGTWLPANGELVATGGTADVLILNDVSISDIAIETDINYADDGGLVVRFIDNNNYYLVTISDDSGANPTANIRIFKRVSGNFTQIGSSANISWTRGTSKTIRFQVTGTALSASVNGSVVTSGTDSAITGPGRVGLRNNGNSMITKFQEFRWGI